MDEHQPTTKQLIAFTVLLSFIASIVGTILTIWLFGTVFGIDQNLSGTVLFSRSKAINESVASSTSSADEPVVRVTEKVSPAVVSIVASKDVPVIERYSGSPFSDDPLFQEFFGNQFNVPQYRQNGTQKQEVSAGSGFLVSADGLIITNKHVVADTRAEYTALTNDGKKYVAEVLARDPVQDLAIIRIKGSSFPWLAFGNSTGAKIGQTVIAIGNALGEFRNTVSVGVISGLERSLEAGGGDTSESLQELIQTDAAINPGNSGGPLLNLHGEVIGVNTAVALGAQNIGFSIPANHAKQDLENVQKNGRIIYPFLGVRYIIITPDLVKQENLARDYGAYIVEEGPDSPAVAAGSPAEQVGLREKDIILALNNEKIDQNHSLAFLLQKYKVGDEITLQVFRGGKEFTLKVRLVERKI